MPTPSAEQSIDQIASLTERFDTWSEKPFAVSIAQTDRYIEFAQELRSALGDALTIIERIRDEHRPLHNSTSALFAKPLCSCDKEYPCATVQAIEESER